VAFVPFPVHVLFCREDGAGETSELCVLNSCSRADEKVISVLIGGNLSSWSLILRRIHHYFPRPSASCPSGYAFLPAVRSYSYSDKNLLERKAGRLLELYIGMFRKEALFQLFMEALGLIDRHHPLFQQWQGYLFWVSHRASMQTKQDNISLFGTTQCPSLSFSDSLIQTSAYLV
jgi:hypothetical protein